MKGEERQKALENLREKPGKKLFKQLDDRLNEKENKNYLVGDKITLADFRVFSFYQIAIREFEPEVLGSLFEDFPAVFRYFNWLKHNEFNAYIRSCRDKQFKITPEERTLINEIYDYWYNTQDLNPVGVELKPLFNRWYFGGEEVDNECKKYLEHIEKAKEGAYDHWAKEPYGRAVLIILLDQFSRNVYRKQAKAFEGD